MTRGTRSIMMVAVLSLFLTVSLAGVALAADTIGVLDPQKVLFQHPKFQEVQKEIKAMMEKKQAEAKAAIEKATDDKEKQKIFNTKRQEAAMEEQKLMQPLFKDIDLAIRTVAKTKGITIVLDKAQVFFGGVDITEDVIQNLKKKYATQ
ncbi:outer membrane chaperone Skp (OmpH) [Thermovirga lienii DSM 17291]|uniref:Outer membrane chaperone Skp (OmpH) n=1 Tax=Thermovirga lienii (strain ATCC BAA-1197 / DSM 17291 / Cas60314) TaxID=580340 RepID=G7V956_THELD|nr:OmpH family outer membrane protein [Thermovirga lienii]AER66425.1 outer membrane chaperone Skp (OmpH) [Thermovirga lienii DSM 17291]